MNRTQTSSLAPRRRTPSFAGHGGVPGSGKTVAHCRRTQDAFTLIEMLLALAVSAIVLAGIGSVFYSAMRLRERTTALLDSTAPLSHALDILRRDLKGALPPNGGMAGDFRSGALSIGLGQNYGLDFSTTTGVIDDNSPWGDVQEVIYELRDPVTRNSSGGKDLVRAVSRNLLSTTALEWDEQLLLSNVETLEFYSYDGYEWLSSWDTSLNETNLPSAVMVRIQLAGEDRVQDSRRQPFEMIVPLVCQSRTNATDTSSESTGGSQ